MSTAAICRQKTYGELTHNSVCWMKTRNNLFSNIRQVKGVKRSLFSCLCFHIEFHLLYALANYCKSSWKQRQWHIKSLMPCGYKIPPGTTYYCLVTCLPLVLDFYCFLLVMHEWQTQQVFLSCFVVLLSISLTSSCISVSIG